MFDFSENFGSQNEIRKNPSLIARNKTINQKVKSDFSRHCVFFEVFICGSNHNSKGFNMINYSAQSNDCFWCLTLREKQK